MVVSRNHRIGNRTFQQRRKRRCAETGERAHIFDQFRIDLPVVLDGFQIRMELAELRRGDERTGLPDKRDSAAAELLQMVHRLPDSPGKVECDLRNRRVLHRIARRQKGHAGASHRLKQARFGDTKHDLPGGGAHRETGELQQPGRPVGFKHVQHRPERLPGEFPYDARPDFAPERMGEYTGVSFKDDFDQLRAVPLLLNRQPGAAVPSPFEPPFRDEPCNRLAHRLDVDAEFRRQLRRGRQQTCVNPFLNPPPQFRHDGRLFVLDHDIPFRLFYYNHTPVIPEVNIKPY